MKIIKLSKEHIKDLIKIENACFSVPWSDSALENLLTNKFAVYFVAQVDEKIVGYAGMYHVADICDITNIAVLPEFRNRGIAKALLEQLICYAKQNNVASVTLEVRKSNTAAVNLYSSFGFVSAGIRKNYYKMPCEDGIIMTFEPEKNK